MKSNDKRNDIVKPAKISGFPENLPAEERLFRQMMSVIQKKFESHGAEFIETPAVEANGVLLSKGADDKEIFGLHQLNGNGDTGKKYSLHFDLTVPLARYVAQHYSRLAFPFKRAQIQKVWRGERPQDGRFREFYQCDIDIIGDGDLSLLADAEVPSIMFDILRDLNIGKFVFRINNRKILNGYLRHLEIVNDLYKPVLIELDKIDKIGADRVCANLVALGMSESDVQHLIETCRFSGTNAEKIAMLRAKEVEEELYRQGVEELETVTSLMQDMGVTEEFVEIDLSIVRGLGYYSGTVYETYLVKHMELGSICSGGRYDNLAEKFTDRHLPGVGMSIGLTRLFSRLLKSGLLPANQVGAADVMVAMVDKDHFQSYVNIAAHLRHHGLRTEVYLDECKLGQQLRYADKKQIPLVVIGGACELDDDAVQLKNMRTGTQEAVTCDGLVAAIREELALMAKRNSGVLWGQAAA